MRCGLPKLLIIKGRSNESRFDQRIGVDGATVSNQFGKAFVDLVVILAGKQIAIELVIYTLDFFVGGKTVIVCLRHEAAAFGNKLMAEHRTGVGSVKCDG